MTISIINISKHNKMTLRSTKKDRLYDEHLEKSCSVLSNMMDFSFAFRNTCTIKNMQKHHKEIFVETIEKLQPENQHFSEVRIPKEIIKMWVSPNYQNDGTVNNMTICMTPNTVLTESLFNEIKFGECICVYEIHPSEKTVQLWDTHNKKQIVLQKVQNELKNVGDTIGLDVKGSIGPTENKENVLKKPDAYFWKPAISQITKSHIGIYATDSKHYLVVKTLADKSYEQLTKAVRNILSYRPKTTLKDFIQNYPYYELHLDNCRRNCGQIAALICQSLEFYCDTNITKHEHFRIEPKHISCKFTKTIDISKDITDASFKYYLSMLNHITHDSPMDQDDSSTKKNAFDNPGGNLVFIRDNNYIPTTYGSCTTKTICDDTFVCDIEDVTCSLPLVQIPKHISSGIRNFVSIPSTLPSRTLMPKHETKLPATRSSISLMRTSSNQKFCNYSVSTLSTPCTSMTMDTNIDDNHYNNIKDTILRHFKINECDISVIKMRPVLIIK